MPHLCSRATGESVSEPGGEASPAMSLHFLLLTKVTASQAKESPKVSASTFTEQANMGAYGYGGGEV